MVETSKYLEREVKNFFVFCFTCQAVLYKPNTDTQATRLAAIGSRNGHSKAYNPPHVVGIIDPKASRRN